MGTTLGCSLPFVSAAAGDKYTSTLSSSRAAEDTGSGVIFQGRGQHDPDGGGHAHTVMRGAGSAAGTRHPPDSRGLSPSSARL